ATPPRHPGAAPRAGAPNPGRAPEAPPPRPPPDARVGEPRFGLVQPAGLVGLLSVEPAALLFQGAELGGGAVARHREHGPFRKEAIHLGARLGPLALGPFGAAPPLGPALPPAPRAPH